MSKATPVHLHNSIEQLARESTASPDYAYKRLSEINNGGAFVTLFTGQSPWERHNNGDELVYIVAGTTQLTLLVGGEEQVHQMGADELMVVPAGIWHRFETEGVKLLTLTPLPTDIHEGDAPPGS